MDGATDMNPNPVGRHHPPEQRKPLSDKHTDATRPHTETSEESHWDPP